LNDVYLLDVNVLVAAIWPTHVFHERVQKWFGQFASRGWATCPMTQSGFVRLTSNPSFAPNALSVADAISLLGANLVHPAHQFWPDEINLAQAVDAFTVRLQGYKQLTDAYLLGLAIYRGAKFATTDRRILELVPENSKERQHVVHV
jgi:toxin-antitoxin system PIN domain toxin